MKLTEHPELFQKLRRPSSSQPLRVLVSGCLAGWGCGVDGTDYGMAGALAELLASPRVEAFAFCPEEHSLGTPRTMPDIHGGDGFAVLAGEARVLDENGADLTEAMLDGGRAMVEFARQREVELALLTDMSAACGSQVISLGCRLVEDRRYQRGVGVATALLIQAGIPVLSQRDYRSLERLRSLLDSSHEVDSRAIDHHETEWYQQTFDESGHE